MKTTHRICFESSDNMYEIPSESVDLVVTSPPYPLIAMWDEMFVRQNPRIGSTLKNNDTALAFELMHQELDPVWNEVWRVTKSGGIVCVNIGDAVRTSDGNFALYPNHARIMTHMRGLGFSALPSILWRKQTNAPNKFMGSGMLPPGAYVTLEHEHILIFRKGGKRKFESPEEKRNRSQSAFFWEERNVWFSDVWTDIKGTSQNLHDDKLRKRSAAFPFEIPYRLINMFSVNGDTVSDPFAGLGTTMFAAMASCRNSVGYEADANFEEAIFSESDRIVGFANRRIEKRIRDHLEFVEQTASETKRFRYANHLGFPVKTRQEETLMPYGLISARRIGKQVIEVMYELGIDG